MSFGLKQKSAIASLKRPEPTPTFKSPKTVLKINLASFDVEYIQTGAENIPLPENSIDTVISTWSFCSISNPELALKEISRVLKTNGKFIFIEHGKSPGKTAARWQKLLTPVSKCLAGGCHMDREIDKLINNAGFEIQKLEKFRQRFNFLTFVYKGIAITKK